MNGSGKSSLLRILAGADKEFDGRMHLVDGIRVGYLEQEPKLDAGPTVEENIRPALAHMQDLLTEFEEARPHELSREKQATLRLSNWRTYKSHMSVGSLKLRLFRLYGVVCSL